MGKHERLPVCIDVIDRTDVIERLPVGTALIIHEDLPLGLPRVFDAGNQYFTEDKDPTVNPKIDGDFDTTLSAAVLLAKVKLHPSSMVKSIQLSVFFLLNHHKISQESRINILKELVDKALDSPVLKK